MQQISTAASATLTISMLSEHNFLYTHLHKKQPYFTIIYITACECPPILLIYSYIRTV